MLEVLPTEHLVDNPPADDYYYAFAYNDDGPSVDSVYSAGNFCVFALGVLAAVVLMFVAKLGCSERRVPANPELVKVIARCKCQANRDQATEAAKYWAAQLASLDTVSVAKESVAEQSRANPP